MGGWSAGEWGGEMAVLKAASKVGWTAEMGWWMADWMDVTAALLADKMVAL